MEKSHFITLVEAYLSGTATPGEQEVIEACLLKLETAGLADLGETDQKETLKQEMWQQIQAQTLQLKDVPVTPMPFHKKGWFRFAAVACSILLFIGLGIWLLTNKQAENSTKVLSKQGSSTPQTHLHREINTTGKDKSIQLPDGSLTVLANNSGITYQDPFVNNRYVYLNGRCYFKVAKNKTKPFTVQSGAVATTALGTEFLITAYNHTDWLAVRLYEGKVVVKPNSHADKKMKKDFYLQPGQEFIYSNNTAAQVRSFGHMPASTTTATQNDNSHLDNPGFSEKNDGSWYMFNNQSLANVLNDLSALYNIKIAYNLKDVEKIYFTGKYNKSKSLDTILERIGKLNGLKIIKTDTAYFIKK